MITRACAGLFLLAAGIACGQTPFASPTFDVASVKRDLSGGNGGAIRPLRNVFTATNSTLQGLIRYAYGVRDYQIHGPDWMNTERYDIEGRAEGEHDSEAMRLMLQNLLAARLGVKLHRDVRQMPLYALVVAKSGSKLRESRPGDSTSVGSTNHSLVARKVSSQDLATALAGQTDRPVLDSTGLAGTFDVNIEWAPDMGTADSVPVGASLFTVLQDQLGLRLESRIGPVDVIVIDHAERIPTEN